MDFVFRKVERVGLHVQATPLDKRLQQTKYLPEYLLAVTTLPLSPGLEYIEKVLASLVSESK